MPCIYCRNLLLFIRIEIDGITDELLRFKKSKSFGGCLFVAGSGRLEKLSYLSVNELLG